MSQSEIDRIAEAVKALEKDRKSDTMKLSEVIFKFISTASLALVMWVLSTVNAMQKDIIQLSSDAQYMRQSLEKLDKFTEQPRFTQENFDLRITPLVSAISSINTSLESIQKRNSDADLTLQKLRLDIEALERKK